MKLNRGAQPGNQNARKHGFYSGILDATDKRNLRQAREVSGLDDEVDLVRAKLRTLVEKDSDNVRLISQAATTLARLLRTRKQLGKSREERMRQAVQKTLGQNPFTDAANL